MELLGKAFGAIILSFFFTAVPLAPIIGAAVFRIETEKNREDEASKRVTTIRSVPTASTGRGRASAPPSTRSTGVKNVATRLDVPYWKDQGWSERNGNLVGKYKTKYGAWKGKVENYSGSHPKLFIFDPPKELDSHPHRRCFMPREGEKFFVHFNPPGPGDPGTAIQKVEKILEESFEE